MASVTCRLRQWGPYTSTRTLAPAPGSKERLRNRHGVIRGKVNASVLSLLPGPPSFSRASHFLTFEFCRSDALIPWYTRYHQKSFHNHWIGSKCQHFGYLVHCHRGQFICQHFTQPWICDIQWFVPSNPCFCPRFGIQSIFVSDFQT